MSRHLFDRAGFRWYHQYLLSRAENADAVSSRYDRWIEAASEQRDTIATLEALYDIALQPKTPNLNIPSYVQSVGELWFQMHFWRRIRFGVEAEMRAAGEDVPAWSDADRLIAEHAAEGSE